MKNKKQTKSTNNYLFARTCDSGCLFQYLLQFSNTQPYTGNCS